MIKKVFLISFFLSLACSYSIAQQAIPKDTLIIMERTPCYGECPFYKLTISADGKVEFEPKSYDEKYKSEISKSRISEVKMRQLISEFEKINFFSLENKYGNYDYQEDKHCPEMWTDHPTVITSITLNGKSKTVDHYLGCEGNPVLIKLTKFEDKIDEIVNTEQWLRKLREKRMNELLKPN